METWNPSWYDLHQHDKMLKRTAEAAGAALHENTRFQLPKPEIQRRFIGYTSAHVEPVCQSDTLHSKDAKETKFASLWRKRSLSTMAAGASSETKQTKTLSYLHHRAPKAAFLSGLALMKIFMIISPQSFMRGRLVSLFGVIVVCKQFLRRCRENLL